MKNSIVMAFLSLTANVLMANAQMSTPWTNPYFFYHYNAPLPPQKTSTHEMDGNNKHHLSDYGDQIISDSLGAHSLLISSCVRELRTTKADLAQTTQRLNDTYTEVENIKDELKGDKIRLILREGQIADIVDVTTEMCYDAWTVDTFCRFAIRRGYLLNHFRENLKKVICSYFKKTSVKEKILGCLYKGNFRV